MNNTNNNMNILSKKVTKKCNRKVSHSSDDDASVCSFQTSSTHSCSTHDSTASSSGGKSVTFRRRAINIYEVPYVCDIDDTADYWYTSGEYKTFKARDKSLLEAMRSASTVEKLEEEVGECTRGLERETPEMKRRSHAHKRESWAIVLSQADPISNADAIAKAYSRCTRSSTRDAAILARLDAMAAEEYASEDSSEYSLPTFLSPKHLKAKVTKLTGKAPMSPCVVSACSA
jgi:hypothetical protein